VVWRELRLRLGIAALAFGPAHVTGRHLMLELVLLVHRMSSRELMLTKVTVAMEPLAQRMRSVYRRPGHLSSSNDPQRDPFFKMTPQPIMLSFVQCCWVRSCFDLVAHRSFGIISIADLVLGFETPFLILNTLRF